MPRAPMLSAAQRRDLLAAVAHAIRPKLDLFDDPTSALDRAKATPPGREAVKELTAAARALDIDRLELTIEIYGAALKKKRERLQRQQAKQLDREREKALRKEQRKQKSESAKYQARKAAWRAGLKAKKPAESDAPETAPHCDAQEAA